MTNSLIAGPVENIRVKDVVRMWMAEELARIRSQEFMNDAERHRISRRLAAGRGWRRLADYATRRADRLSQQYEG